MQDMDTLSTLVNNMKTKLDRLSLVSQSMDPLSARVDSMRTDLDDLSQTPQRLDALSAQLTSLDSQVKSLIKASLQPASSGEGTLAREIDFTSSQLSVL